MKRMNKDGVLLCELQATAFEKSIDKMESSSEIFIRRFMRSRIAKRLDDGSVLESNIQAEDILQLVNEEYGFSNYGSVKYTRNEMYWIGYIYRYFVITYELTSMQVYKIVKPKELKGLFEDKPNSDNIYALSRDDYDTEEAYQQAIAEELEVQDYYTEKNVFWVHLRLLSEYWKQKACLQMKKWNWNVSMKYSKEYEIKKYKGLS